MLPIAAVVVASSAWLAIVDAAPPSSSSSSGSGAPTERRLHVAGAEASSYLANDWNRFQENYLPLYVGDDDPNTAWTDGIKGDGVGEWVRVRVTPMKGATRIKLRVRNGYQKSKKLFAANSRARAVTIKLLPSGKTSKVELADQWDWQDVNLEQPAGSFDAVEFHFESTYPGTKYDDLCISDVQLFVTATSPENPAFEKQRFASVQKWRSERQAAAKLFKSSVGKGLPLASSYVVETQSAEDKGKEEIKNNAQTGKIADCPNDGHGFACTTANAVTEMQSSPRFAKYAAVLEQVKALAKSNFSQMQLVQVVSQDQRRTPRVDGLCTPSLNSCEEDPCYDSAPLPMTGTLGFLNARSLSTLEVKTPVTIAEAEALRPKACHQRNSTTFSWIVRAPAATDGTPGTIRSLYLVSCGLVDGREGFFPSARSQLLVYADDGRLAFSQGYEMTSLYDWREGNSGPVLEHVAGVKEGYWFSVRESSVVARR